MLGLLIYQGLTRNDIVNLTLDDIDLNEGTIYIKTCNFEFMSKGSLYTHIQHKIATIEFFH